MELAGLNVSEWSRVNVLSCIECTGSLNTHSTYVRLCNKLEKRERLGQLDLSSNKSRR